MRDRRTRGRVFLRSGSADPRGSSDRIGRSVAERDAERFRRQQQIDVERHGLRLAHDVLERGARRCPADRTRPSCRTRPAGPARPPCRRSASPARDRSWSARRRAAGGRARPSAFPFRHRVASASQTCAPMPPSRSAYPSCASSSSDSDPAFGNAPSATTTMLNFAPQRSRAQQPVGDDVRCRTESRESGSRRRRRRRRRTARSIRHSGPSPRRP